MKNMVKIKISFRGFEAILRNQNYKHLPSKEELINAREH